MILAFFLTRFLQYNYAPSSHAFWEGAVWPNVFVIAIVAPFGYLWSRTKWWPLRPLSHAIHGLHLKLDAHHTSLESLHERLTNSKEDES